MKLAKVRLADGSVRVASVEDQTVKLLNLSRSGTIHCLADILREDDPVALARLLIDEAAGPLPAGAVRLLAPIDSQEVWAAGVTYKRSQIARMEESEAAASHYDKVYTAPRPEIFFKATPNRVSGPGEPVRVRADSQWIVPEPELTLVISPKGNSSASRSATTCRPATSKAKTRSICRRRKSTTSVAASDHASSWPISRSIVTRPK